MYGFPAIDGPTGGVKVASEQHEVVTTPEKVKREISKDEIEYMYGNYVKDRLPMLSGNCVKAVSCMYTSTPNSDFVIQRHPKFQQVIVASPCSGHGFKHSASIGEALAELVCTGSTTLDISKFRISD